MTELRHLQLVILDIIKDIDIVCKNNGIEYYLLGGSAIGAIRHKARNAHHYCRIEWLPGVYATIEMLDNTQNRCCIHTYHIYYSVFLHILKKR